MFETLKAAFSSWPVLSIPNVTRPFSIMTDASLFAAGAILLQSNTNGDLHPCAYFSCTFLPTEQNYDIYDLELLVVILALTEWCQYVQGTSHPVSIITDHKNLSYIKDPANSLADKPVGLSSYRTSIFFGRFSQVPNLPLPISFPATTKLTPPLTTPIPLLSQNPQSSMLSI